MPKSCIRFHFFTATVHQIYLKHAGLNVHIGIVMKNSKPKDRSERWISGPDRFYYEDDHISHALRQNGSTLNEIKRKIRSAIAASAKEKQFK